MWKATACLVCAYGVAHGEVELSDVGDIEAFSLEDLLEKPVVSASRYAQNPADTPILVSSIDAEQIDALGYRSLAEALRSMRGIYLTNDRNYSYLGTRGFAVPGDYNTRFALSIDGHRMNDPVYGQALLGRELGLPLLAIDRVELVRGGAWSVYGQNALLGALNVVTATGSSRPGLRLRASGSSTAETYDDATDRDRFALRTQAASASYGFTKPGLDVFAAAQLEHDPGMPALSMPELASDELTCVDARRHQIPCTGIVRGGDGEDVASAYLAIKTRKLSVRSLAGWRRKYVPTGAYGTNIGDQLDTVDNRVYTDLAYATGDKRGDIEARFAIDYYRYHGNYPFADSREGHEELPASRVVNDDGADALWLTAEVRGRRKWKRLGAYLRDVEIAAGVETQQQQGSQHSIDLYPEGSITYLDRMDTARMMAVTTHGSARAFDHLVGFAALRGDYYPDAFGLTINPQLGLVLDFEDYGRVRATLARGFRAPNLYEANWLSVAGTADITTQPPSQLGPERSETREVSYERYLTEHVRAIGVVFTQEISDLIALSTSPDGDQRFINEGSSSSKGFEIEVAAHWPSLQLRGSYAYQLSKDGSGDVRVNSPRSLAVGTVLVPIGKRQLLSFEANYIGSRLALDRTSIAPTVLATAGYTVRDVTDGLDLSLGVRNLFDTRSPDPGGAEHTQTRIPTEPRTVWLMLTARIGDQP